MLDFPLHRFEEFGTFTRSEREALASIVEKPVRLSRHTRLREEGVKPDGFFLLFSGWVASAHTLPNGGRQILKIHLPGDVLGSPSMGMLQTVEALSALTDVVVAHVAVGRFAALCEAHPRIAMKFMLSIQSERIALMDRLSSIGRTSAVQRVAAFIADIMERLEPLGEVHDDSFHMVVTQEQIGDVVGLTSVHTNRALKMLTEEGLIARVGTQYQVLDRQQLIRLAATSPRVRHIDPPWLPRPR